MRTRDLQVDVMYATCNGIPVRPQPSADGEVHASWRKYREGGVTSIKDTTASASQGTPEDAWSSCIKAKPLAGHFTGDKGLRVMQYDHGPAGEIIKGSGREVLLDPKDIKGTWADFRLLHINVIEHNWAQRVKDWLEAEFEWQMEQMNSLILPPGVDLEVNRYYAGEGKYETRATLTFAVREHERDKRDEATPEEKWMTIQSVLRDVERLDLSKVHQDIHLLRAGAEVS